MEHKFNSLPSKEEYVEKVITFLTQNDYDFEKDEDSSSNVIGEIHVGGEMYHLSYETDELAPYLVITKMIAVSPEEMELKYQRLLQIANVVNNEMIVAKMQVVREYGVFFYVAAPFPFLPNLDSFIAYSIDAINLTSDKYMNKLMVI